MKKVYSSAFKVCLIFFSALFIGIYCGLSLPVSLYPNSSKPTVWINFNSYGQYTTKEFSKNYGESLEQALMSYSDSRASIDSVQAYYNSRRGHIDVKFDWGVDSKYALSEVQNLSNSISSSWPKEIRDNIDVRFWSKSSGFVAISFFSPERSVDGLFEILDNSLSTKLSQVEDAESANLYNPNSLEIDISLNPHLLSEFQVFPLDVERAICKGLRSLQAGDLKLGRKNLKIIIDRKVNSIDDLKNVIVRNASGKNFFLSQLADVTLRKRENSSQIFKTNGSESLILFAKPKSGANIKKMAEELKTIVASTMTSLPSDIEYKLLVDPSEFIRASIHNVSKDVVLASLLAVMVLFLFLGSFKNTITAAFEIPAAIILSFILMKVFHMNINLISLGGLALAAGMNVDASVVVLENIFRHLDLFEGKLSFSNQLNIVSEAVGEVFLPILASTLSTLVVFTPIIFTSNLTSAILGDLAKAVVFSHLFSLLIALFIVPIVRVYSLKTFDKDKLKKSSSRKVFRFISYHYSKALRSLLLSPKVQKYFILFVFFLVASSVLVVAPRLKKELVATPDTDWMILGVRANSNSHIKQMETEASIAERELLKKFEDYFKYTFVQIRGKSRASIMAKLKSKSLMNEVWQKMQEAFVSTPDVKFWVIPWNPVELPLPDPEHFRLIVKAKNRADKILVIQELKDLLRDNDVWDRVSSEPSTYYKEDIKLKVDELNLSSSKEISQFPFEKLFDFTRVATKAKRVSDLSVNGESVPIYISFPKDTLKSLDDLTSYPISVGGKIVPLGSLVEVSFEKSEGGIYKNDLQEVFMLKGSKNEANKSEISEATKESFKIIEKYKKRLSKRKEFSSSPQIIIEDSFTEFNDALEQLSMALIISIFLILLTLLLQFGHFIHSFIILSVLPIAISGGVLSLYFLGSTLSLNSVLGIILLNGLAVNNSIILVDFIKKNIRKGITPIEAVISACSIRLRPILITSLTTILGVIPMALGLGEGGKILQPLGIAVCGGLWISMLLTIFLIPLLEYFFYRNEVFHSDLEDKSNQKLKSPFKGHVKNEIFV